MKIDETYFTGTETEDSTTSLDTSEKSLDEFPYIITYTFEDFVPENDDTLHTIVSTLTLLLEQRKSVSDFIVIFIEQDEEENSSLNIGLSFAKFSVTSVIDVLYLLHKALEKSGEPNSCDCTITDTNPEQQFPEYDASFILKLFETIPRSSEYVQNGVNTFMMDSDTMFQYEQSVTMLCNWFGKDNIREIAATHMKFFYGASPFYSIAIYGTVRKDVPEKTVTSDITGT